MEYFKKEHKTTLTHYPAPYSQSWSGVHPAHRRKTNSADKSLDKTTNKKQVFPRKKDIISPQLYSGLDPTVPHLKYGLFPKKIYISRGQSRTLSTEPSVRTSQITDIRQEQVTPKRTRSTNNEGKKKVDQPSIGKTATIQKLIQNPREQGETSENSPMFVFRPLEKRNLRSLTVSASTHLDIKPRPPRGPILSPQLYRKFM